MEMKTIINIIVAIWILVSSTYAQQVEVVDSIDAIILENFRVPQNRNIVLTNILDVNFKAELYDMNLNKIRDCDNQWQDPAASNFPVSGKRGKMVQYSVTEEIDDAGVFFIKVIINYRDEESSNTLEALYRINVEYPTMSTTVDLRDSYYFSETKTFSFATLELSNIQNYSFEILDEGGTIVDSGKSSLISLDDVLNNENLVEMNLTAVGYYKNKKFKYLDSKSNELKESKWRFRINKPEMDQFVTWKKRGDEGNRVISIYNDRAMNFLYLYVGKTPNGFAAIAPRGKNLIVTSEPKNFVQSYLATTSGKFLFVDILVNPDFVDQMEECGEQEVSLRIKFVTQFGEKIDYEYFATVIN
jgi:hypothetical protein